MCFHYTTHYAKVFSPSEPALFDFPLGYYGVYLFFMISGFVILMTLEKTKHPIDFVVSRFSRLYPVYWAAIALTFSAVYIFGLPGRGVSFDNALINLSMLQKWLGVKNVDGVYWTLSIELSFYFFLLVIFTLGGLKNIELFGFIWLALMVWDHKLNISMPKLLDKTQLLSYGHLFFAGILFYKIKMEGSNWHRILGLVFCLGVQYIFRARSYDSLPFYNYIIVFIFFIVFYLFILDGLSWIINKPMAYLGTISYSLYLIHQNIGFIIIQNLYKVHANAWARFFIPVAASILIASALTFWIERPAMKFIKDLYARRKSAGPGSKIPS